MRTESFKQDLINFIDDKRDIVEFLLFVKKNPDARDILSHYGYRFEYLAGMTDEEIKREYSPFSHGCLAEDPENGIMLDILVKAIENNNDVKSLSETFVDGLADVFFFKAGVPIVCDLMIGNEDNYYMLDAIQGKNTGNYTYDCALNDYDAFIDCGLESDETIGEIDIKLPFDDWNHDNIKALYEYISKHFNYDNRSATYTFGDDNELSHVKIKLSNSLYEIYIENYIYEGRAYLKIMIVRLREDSKIYQALNTLLDSEETDDLVWSTVKTIIKQESIKTYFKY